MDTIKRYISPFWIRIFSHSLFWIAYIVFAYFQYMLYGKKFDSLTAISSLSITALVDISATYFTVYFLLPKYLFKKQYIPFTLLFLSSAALAIIAQRVLMYYVIYPLFFAEEIAKNPTSFWHINPFYSFFNIYTVVSIFASIKLMKYWYKNQQLRIELENKSKSSELALLKTQLNPHFLFNTLNNIDALISSNQDKASDAVIKLSEIMRFTLYDASNDSVTLEKEINYLENYISLQKLRLRDPDFVSFKINANCKGMNVVPMLFIPFVENAFKHSVKNVVSPGIEITLSCYDGNINFEVVNRYSLIEEHNTDNTSGIGLVNTKKRLELLYPDNHKLEIRKSANLFKVRLVIYKQEKDKLK